MERNPKAISSYKKPCPQKCVWTFWKFLFYWGGGEFWPWVIKNTNLIWSDPQWLNQCGISISHKVVCSIKIWIVDTLLCYFNPHHYCPSFPFSTPFLILNHFIPFWFLQRESTCPLLLLYFSFDFWLKNKSHSLFTTYKSIFICLPCFFFFLIFCFVCKPSQRTPLTFAEHRQTMSSSSKKRKKLNKYLTFVCKSTLPPVYSSLTLHNKSLII